MATEKKTLAKETLEKETFERSDTESRRAAERREVARLGREVARLGLGDGERARPARRHRLRARPAACLAVERPHDWPAAPWTRA
ncbi:MAG: hypothetical protein OHK0013_07810 [Sandaracinaceae bacterium]